jgi:hypothetical protein
MASQCSELSQLTASTKSTTAAAETAAAAAKFIPTAKQNAWVRHFHKAFGSSIIDVLSITMAARPTVSLPFNGMSLPVNEIIT